MDVMVYARNGEYVDGFIVTLYKDRVQNSAYARFYGFDAYGQLKPAHQYCLKREVISYKLQVILSVDYMLFKT